MISLKKLIVEDSIKDFDHYVEKEIRERINFLQHQKLYKDYTDEELYEFAEEYANDRYRTDLRLTEKRKFLRIGIPHGLSKVGLDSEWKKRNR